MPTTTDATRTERSAVAVTLRGVSRAFPQGTDWRPVLRDIDLKIAAGEIIAVLGASGCGKSTLLRQIAGLDTPDGGSISIDGGPVDGIDARVAVAFQEPRLLPWRSIARNVELGLHRERAARTAGRERVAELLRLVGLAEAAGKRPREVSGGMAQRASLARALARNPGVLVLDEPFGALDALTRLRMQDLLLDIHAARPATVVLVTHDVDEALYLADRVVVLGPVGDAPGATVDRLISVPGERPRDRGDARLASLRAELLDALGVPTHHAASAH